jgi:hypothetical protein
MKYIKRTLYTVAIIIFALAINTPAWADDYMLPDTFMLRLGGYAVNSANTVMRLDSANAPVGAYIDFHDTLGGDTRTTIFRADGLYRFNERHALGFAWYDVKFTGSRVLNTQIDWGGQTYPVNAQVNSKLEFDVYKLNYQYSVFHDEKAELGASFGFHIMRLSVGISGTSTLGTGQAASEKVTAPLPVWGLFADYNFTPRFSAYYNYQFFFINVDDKFKGGLQDFIFGLEYRLFRNVAVGAAYNRFALNAEIKKDVSTLKINTNWNGGMLYGAVYF